MTIPQPDQLKCEYMVDPIGIDTGKPRFEGITILEENDGYVRLNAASGFYEFEVLS